jgi:rhodanese-related sulfurtransferase
MWWWPFGTVSEIAAGELAARLDAHKPLQLVDVRTRHEWTQDHIAGSINIPITELKQRIGELDPAKPTVAICLTGHRSIVAVRLLTKMGFVDVVQLGGGLRRWRRLRHR